MPPSPEEAAHTVPVMLAEMRRVGLERFIDEVFQNRQRTSPQNGILKGDAMYRFASVLETYNFHALENPPRIAMHPQMEQQLRAIPGQMSGKSLVYFFMLCGDENLMKPDRMTLGFLRDVLGKEVTDAEAQTLLAQACDGLRHLNAELTPRRLDNEIWKYQRAKSSTVA